jgi:dCTP deaminase
MVLSGKAIKAAVEKGVIGIEPYSPEDVEAVHVNLYLGEIDPTLTQGAYTVTPKAFLIAKTKECITLPSHLCGFVEGRAKLAKVGLSVEQSSTLVEPGTDHQLTLEIFNASDSPIILESGQKIAKLVIMRVGDDFEA